MEPEKFVAYLRRSKKEQSSNLGLEAQSHEVNKYIKNVNGLLINTYVEIESGTNGKLKRRVAIWDAIQECQESNAILIIAKLDRLARDVEFVTKLQNAGVRFIACDIPTANEFTIHVMAAVAQQEAKRISERTKAALDRKRQRGEPLGFYTHKDAICKLTETARATAARKLKERARANPNNLRARGYAQSLKARGLTHEAIADRLNREGFTSPMGKKIQIATVSRWLIQH